MGLIIRLKKHFNTSYIAALIMYFLNVLVFVFLEGEGAVTNCTKRLFLLFHAL